MRTVLNKFRNTEFDHLTEAEVIEQIHQEAYSAEEKLLKEANDIINSASETNKIEENTKKLIKLGFTSEKKVKDTFNVIKDVEQAKKIKELIGYYNFKYPFNKFINEQTLSNINKKYGLVLATVDRFIGAIPEKNKTEIINFKVDSNDVRSQYLNRITEFLNSGRELNKPEQKKSEYIAGTNLLIMATTDLLNTKGMHVSGYSLVNDDPIVLQPVIGGYLIVSIWGPEANDEELRNQNFN